MAILRIGSRLPETDVATGRFLFDSPPWVPLPEWVEPPSEVVPEDAAPGIPLEALRRTDIPAPRQATQSIRAAEGTMR